MAGREFIWGEDDGVDSYRGRIECYDTPENAKAAYERSVSSQSCVDAQGNEIDATVVDLPVTLGDQSAAQLCQTDLSARAQLGDATIYFLRQSTEDLAADDVTVADFTDFATLFLLTAAAAS